MKVAVMGKNNDAIGKSSLIVMLSSLFARTQRRDAAIFSTSSLESLMQMVDVDTRAAETKTVGVYKALLEAATIRNREILDYGMKVGSEYVYLFNLFSAAMSEKDSEELFIKTINKIKVDLVLVEVTGDINSDFNHAVLKECDAILCMFEQSRQSMNFVKEYRENYDKYVVARTGYICSKYQPDAISGKRLLNFAGIHERETIFIPYTPYVIKHSLEGDLNNIAKLICNCEPEVLPLRAKLLETMQYLFDTPSYKYIKDYTTWFK